MSNDLPLTIEEQEKVRIEKIYDIFIRWYAIPQESREPKTIDEFCKQFKLSNSLIAEFQTRDTFTEDLYRASIAWGKSKIPELLHILYAKFKLSKNPNDLRMYRDLLVVDRPDKKDTQDDNSRSGVLRELFSATK